MATFVGSKSKVATAITIAKAFITYFFLPATAVAATFFHDSVILVFRNYVAWNGGIKTNSFMVIRTMIQLGNSRFLSFHFFGISRCFCTFLGTRWKREVNWNLEKDAFSNTIENFSSVLFKIDGENSCLFKGLPRVYLECIIHSGRYSMNGMLFCLFSVNPWRVSGISWQNVGYFLRERIFCSSAQTKILSRFKCENHV